MRSSASSSRAGESGEDSSSAQVRARQTLKWRAGALHSEGDALAIEEPLEIRLGGKRFTLTMRTPGHDEELAAGFLLAEGFIRSRAEIDEIRRMIDRKGHPEPNAIDVILKVPADAMRQRMRRNFTISSSCGVCGKTSIESLMRRIEPVKSAMKVRGATISSLPTRMRAAQEAFAATGGLHAAALFDRAGTLQVIREDVGRHNAVDKAIGWAIFGGKLPLDETLLMVSGRLSFEIVQKGAVAGIAIVAAVSAPSSLAVELGEESGVTLIGFLRESGFNVYCHAARVSS